MCVCVDDFHSKEFFWIQGIPSFNQSTTKKRTKNHAHTSFLYIYFAESGVNQKKTIILDTQETRAPTALILDLFVFFPLSLVIIYPKLQHTPLSLQKYIPTISKMKKKALAHVFGFDFFFARIGVKAYIFVPKPPIPSPQIPTLLTCESCSHVLHQKKYTANQKKTLRISFFGRSPQQRTPPPPPPPPNNNNNNNKKRRGGFNGHSISPLWEKRSLPRIVTTKEKSRHI